MAFSCAIISLYFYLHKSESIEVPIWPIFGIAVAVLLFTRVYPFIAWHSFPLGYDTGIYKWHFEQAWKIFPSFNTGLYPGIFLITDLLYAIGLKSVNILREGYVFFDLLILVSLFLYCRREFGIKVAAIVAFLFAVSLAQAQAYSFILYKNIIALSVTFFAFLLIEKRSYWAILPAAYLVFLQPPDFVLFGLTVAIYFLLNIRDAEKRKFIIISMLATGAVGSLLYFINPQMFKDGLNTLINFKDVGEAAQREGLFMDPSAYLGLAILYIPLALFGFGYLINNRKFNLVFSYFVVTLIFIVFKLVFYKRFLIEFDLAVIALAGLGAYLIFRKFYLSKEGKIAVWMLVAGLILANIYGTLNYRPFISKGELEEIKWLSETSEPNSIAMATTSQYSPWILGFSNRPTIAPGIFDVNRWGFDEWMRFWTGKVEDHIDLWRKYSDMTGRPVYLFYGQAEPWPDFGQFPIYKRVSNFFWKYKIGAVPVVEKAPAKKSVKK